MKRTRVKICGFTTIEEAKFAAEAGVDAIGLVFFPSSPRHVSIDQAQEIVAALPAFITVVALFVNASEATIKEIIRQVPIDLLQFHGDETAEACRLYAKPYIKAVRMRPETHIQTLSSEFYDAAGLLLDAFHAQTQGGTGQKFDWNLIPEQCDLPLILAGGLDIHNVTEAMHRANPYAIDVSSGVESAKGIKDNNKIAAFLTEVYQSDRQN